MTKGIVYYTDNRTEERLAALVRKQILRCFDGEIVSVSQFPLDFGRNIVVDYPRASTSIFKQIYDGLKASTADIVYLCEHDVLYHKSHFDKVPRNPRRFYYNENRWQVCAQTGQALFRFTHCTSLLVAHRDLLMQYFEEFFKFIEVNGWHRKKMGFAPGTHEFGMSKYRLRTWMSEVPCIDVRHGTNWTPNRFRKEQYSNYSQRGWQEAEEVPGWGRTWERFNDFLREVDRGLIGGDSGPERNVPGKND